MNDDVSTLTEWIADSPSTVFFGGAGVSTESGIPDFRGANGFYFQEREIPLETVLSIDFFTLHPEAYWEWFHEIYRPVEPNGAHRALASLEAAGRLDAVITQNIDGLHQRAGSRAVWELHGNWERLVCTSCGAGTSLVVYPAAGLINYFSGDHLVLMNATPTSADAHADLIIREPVGATLDRVMDQLRALGVVTA